MNTTTIQLQYVNPRDGNRPASVKDITGKRYSIPDWMQGQVAVGGTYSVEYETAEKNNVVYYNIKGFVGGKPTARQAPAPMPQQASALVPPQGQQQTVFHTDAEAVKAENIFVCGVVNSAITHQSYPIDEQSLAALVTAARAAWRKSR
jgi:hypothetical protein